MHFRCTISCDSAAFGDKPELHLADVLRGIANTIQYVGTGIEHRPTVRTPVCDVNGIRCGTWEMIRDGERH
jgi:hypothetical protein